MHTTASPTANTNLTKMLSLFRKSKSSSASTVMANANTSETTLVSAPAKTSKGQRKPKYETEPYQAEFTGLSTLGGMPSLGGHFFVEPPKAKKTVVKMVPAQPFKASPRASFVEDRLSTVQVRDSFETLSTSVASSTSSTGSGHPTSYQRKLLKQHKAFFNNSFANT